MGDMPAPVGSDYLVSDEVEFEVRHKQGIFEYTINDPQGSLLFDVRGQTYLKHLRRVLRDPSGNVLVLLKNKVGSRHDTWTAYRGIDESDGNLLFTMKKSSVFQITPSYEIFLPNNESSLPDFIVKGNFWERNYIVLYRDTIVAKAKKKFNLSYPVVIGKDRYFVKLYPGIDRAFIASVVVIINEQKEEKRREIVMY